ncbi:MAG: PEP-CTERM sorting domain-containing protein [Pseudomonadales bacterium]|nr:PEP-CTERM sorting domain-containing protein [Pseudomonadales bacterium]
MNVSGLLKSSSVFSSVRVYLMSNIRVLAFLVLGLLAGTSHATVVNQLNSAGDIIGATGVSVAGSLYDVEFVTGTCLAVFTNCTQFNHDFTFTSAAEASDAAQSLFDQVFPADAIGLVDVVTVFDVLGGTVVFGKDVNFHGSDPSGNFVGDTADHNFVTRTFAKWSTAAPSSVPEPSTFGLIALGICGLIFSRKRKV